ncbi:MAG: hypothetical protein LUD52_05330 [Opitutae bacterium]|nr:hypothetical protein [Opitutae bacterium]
MKKFLLKSLLAFAIIFVIVVLPNLLYSIIAPRRVAQFELPRDKTIIFIGDSHVERGVDDKFIPGGFNFSKSWESYLNIYPRLKKLLDKNPQITTVFIGVTPHSIRENADIRLYNNDTMYLLCRNLGIYSMEELKHIEIDTYFGYLFTEKGFKDGLDLFWGLITKNSQEILKEMGCFDAVEGRNLQKDLVPEVVHRRLYSEGDGEGHPPYGNEVQKKYLRKIVDMARAHGARVIFLNPPIYHVEEFFDVPYFENLLKTEFADVEFWDYVNFSVPEDCWQNENHINRWGAEILSKELARRMQEEGIVATTNPGSTTEPSQN